MTRKTLLRKVLVCAIALMIAVCALAFQTSAAVSAKVTVSNSKPNVGDKITVKLNVSAGEAIAANDATLTYDGSVLQFVSLNISEQDYTSTKGSLHIVDPDFDGVGKSANYTVTFKVLKAGDSKLAFSGTYANNDYKETSYAKSSSVTAKVQLNKNLSSLSVTGGKLSPAFSAGKTSYTVTVDGDTEKVTIDAKAQDSTATVSGTGTYNVAIGSKKFTVSVTASDGTKKDYSVTVKRPDPNAVDEPDDPADDPVMDSLTAKIGNEEYTVSETLANAPKLYGFVDKKATYNGTEVSVRSDVNGVYQLYYLQSKSGKSGYYIYREQKDEFEPVTYFNIGKQTYLPFDDGLTTPPDGYSASEINLGNVMVKTYVSDDLRFADFGIFYAFSGGKAQYYRYDGVENTIQRYPEFSEVSAAAEQSGKIAASAKQDKSAGSNRGFFDWFNGLGSLGKVTLAAFVLVVLCLIGLIIIFPIMLLKKRKENNADSDRTYGHVIPDGADMFFDNTVSLDVDPALQQQDPKE